MMLFPSTLFISSQPLDILPHLQDLGHLTILNNPDILIIDDYKIEKIKEINLFLAKAPYSHSSKIVFIENANLLGIEAQNALLKNIEEPGDHNYFILTSPNSSSLIPTIVSRCHLIKIISDSIENTPILTPKANIRENLALTDSLNSDAESLLRYLKGQISLHHQNLLKTPNQQTNKFIHQLIKATQMINSHVDTKSVLDFLLLS